MRFGTNSVIGEKLDRVRGISRKTREIGDARGRQDNSDLAPSPSKSGIAVSISAPADLRVPVGGSEVVMATVTGTKDNAVEWGFTGKGCSGSVCGKMTGDLYVAPSALPAPPLVTLTAVSKADPTAKASVNVRIVERAPRD